VLQRRDERAPVPAVRNAAVAVCNFASPVSATFPGAAAGFDQVFVDPSSAVVVSPSIVETGITATTPDPWCEDALAAIVVPPGGYDRHWTYIDVPDSPALVGAVYSAQSVRLDANGQWYWSNEKRWDVQ
jgi:hypothetical protein